MVVEDPIELEEK